MLYFNFVIKLGPRLHENSCRLQKSWRVKHFRFASFSASSSSFSLSNNCDYIDAKIVLLTTWTCSSWDTYNEKTKANHNDDRNQNANLSRLVHENLPFINGCTKLLDFIACVVFSHIWSSIVVCVLHTIGHSHSFGFRVRVANSFYQFKSNHEPERFFKIEFWAVNNQWERKLGQKRILILR